MAQDQVNEMECQFYLITGNAESWAKRSPGKGSKGGDSWLPELSNLTP